MQQASYCTPGRYTTCEGHVSDCPRCGDPVCESHAFDGLCLACQDDADELGIEPGELLAWDAQEELA
jgi:hypothetical protein